jgi:hypothetical protein
VACQAEKNASVVSNEVSEKYSSKFGQGSNNYETGAQKQRRPWRFSKVPPNRTEVIIGLSGTEAICCPRYQEAGLGVESLGCLYCSRIRKTRIETIANGAALTLG